MKPNVCGVIKKVISDHKEDETRFKQITKSEGTEVAVSLSQAIAESDLPEETKKEWAKAWVVLSLQVLSNAIGEADEDLVHLIDRGIRSQPKLRRKIISGLSALQSK